MSIECDLRGHYGRTPYEDLRTLCIGRMAARLDPFPDFGRVAGRGFWGRRVVMESKTARRVNSARFERPKWGQNQMFRPRRLTLS